MIRDLAYTLILGPAIFGTLSLLSAALIPVIEAAWFGYRRPEYPAQHWVALAVACSAAYGLFRLLDVVSGDRSPRPSEGWVRSYLVFLALFYWIMAIHAVLLVELSWTASWKAGELSFPVLEVLLVSSVGAILWVFAFERDQPFGEALGIFGASSLVLVVALLISQPETIKYVMIQLGFLEPAKSWVSGVSSFSRDLAYIAPLGPILFASWSAYRGRAQPDR